MHVQANFLKLEQNKTVENNNVKSINFVAPQRHQERKTNLTNLNLSYYSQQFDFVLKLAPFIRFKQEIHEI